MKPLYVLTAAVLLAIAAGVWFIQQSGPNEFQAQALFDDLEEAANDLDSVKIENAQGVVFAAENLNDSWQATITKKLPTYPISQDKLAQLVTTLLQLKLIEPKTSKAENYSRLGLQDIDNTDSLASLVTLRANGRSWSVLVGNQVSFAEGSYVRLPKNKQSWRTNKNIHLPLDKYSWLKQPILPFRSGDIVAITRVDNSNWQMAKQDDGSFQLSPMLEGRKLEYQGVLEAMASSIVELDFEQLYVSEEIFNSSLTVVTELEISMSQGDLIRLVVSEMDGKYLVSFPTEFPAEYWHSWHYQISNFSAQQLIKTADDFLADKSKALINETTSDAKTLEEGESPF